MNAPTDWFDINCDLAEGEPEDRTRRLMGLITSANICCGIHAGSPETARRAAEIALELGIHAGAHPGLRGRFGRGSARITPEEFSETIRAQVFRFAEDCARVGVRASHVKLHGVLYHLAEDSPEHRQAFANLAREFRERCGIARVFAKAGGVLARLLTEEGSEVFEEIFLDRGYLSDGGLVPREMQGAVIADAGEVVRRLALYRERGLVLAVDGTPLPIRARTFCVHGDNPGALDILRAVAALRGLRGC